MSRCEFRPAAAKDLESIADYIAEDNPSRAVTFIQEIREKCRLLAEMPKSAPARPELGRDIRSRPAGNYVIYYQPLSDGVEIIRILHARRDVDPDIIN
jgi:toxin ParE1/3/4